MTIGATIFGRAGWTQPSELRAKLRRRWDSGRYLSAHARGEPFEPFGFSLHGPRSTDLLEQLDACRSWVAEIERFANPASLAYKVVRGPNLGANRVPARISIDSLEQLCILLGTKGEVEALDALLTETSAVQPELRDWVAAHPMAALTASRYWTDLLRTVAWIASSEPGRLYLREIEVDGIDTKFVERHRKLLDDLLTELLPDERIRTGETEFASRFGFLSKPSYTRLRTLGNVVDPVPARLTEIALRTDELARHVLDVGTVFVVENEITYLAFPDVPEAVVIFGAGFSLTRLAHVPWLATKAIVYWGDIDTHGFDILDRLRARHPHVESLLMDETTLLVHRPQWVSEPRPTRRDLPHLTPDEAALYTDLVGDRYGPGIRLEQERISFKLLTEALRRRVT